MIKKLWFSFFLACILPVSVFAQTYDYNSKVFQRIVNQLAMQGHKEHDLATCTVKQQYYKEVLDMLNKGKSEDEILNYYVEQLGEQALVVPQKSGFSLTAWVVPIAIFMFGAFVIYRTVRRKEGN
ncbi:cytochrome c-type biogenesis protein CcmH [Anoxybacillus sp. MB8]|uniref:cytochrome c-type biogenesis protein CcmH n=1 Tax=Anoxybacillus sp. MB8 TaxID=2496850 RepID=UPI0013D312C8|nr:cytochrome c-type biogenesis protein CcmH [Anoxybacillus sp. MB8]